MREKVLFIMPTPFKIVLQLKRSKERNILSKFVMIMYFLKT